MLSLIENYKGLVQLKMNLMIYIKQACSTAFDVNVFKAKVLFSFFFFFGDHISFYYEQYYNTYNIT